MELNAAYGRGHRKIAARLDRPESTVRDWLRDFRANAPAIVAAFAVRVHRATAEALSYWPSPSPTATSNALGMLMAHARLLAEVHHHESEPVVTVPWQYAALFAHGPWFFSRVGWPDECNTSPPCR
ncbi:helix-turn-helix domain-containing protein [Specibacter sp. AOP5-B1-6]